MEPEMEEELARSGIPVALQTLKDFLAKIAGPAAEEFGLLLGDKVRTWRVRNAARVLVKTRKMLKDGGVEPSSVPLKTLVPLFEGASLEEDDDLSGKWAALLANAATAGSQPLIHPGFPNTLSQLTPVDARFLDEVAKAAQSQLSETDVPRPPVRTWVSVAPLVAEWPIGNEDLQATSENLERLGLLEMGPSMFEMRSEDAEATLDGGATVAMTRFGFRFVMACCYPQSRRPL